MKKTFEDKELELYHEAAVYILSKVKDKPIKFEYEEDELNALPGFQYVTKHSHYLWYAITEVKIENERVTLVGLETGEDGDINEVYLEELFTHEVLSLADYIENILS